MKSSIEKTYLPVSRDVRGIEYWDTDTKKRSIAHYPFDKSEITAIISGSLNVLSDPLGIWDEPEEEKK